MLAVAPGAILLTGCGSEAEKKVAEKPAEPMTGLRALYQMYGVARSWAPDVKLLHLSSIDLVQVKSQPGKLGAWQAVFASETKGQKRAYMNSTFDVSVTLRKGVFPEGPSQWSEYKRALPMSAIQTDSDKAFEVAMKHGGDYAKKNPNMPISFLLEMGRNVNLPLWRVIWGESPSSSTFSVLVEAANGTFFGTLS